MRLWNTLFQSNFFIRLRSWEYWPFGIVHFPAILYWLWLSLRTRSITFFSASNPGILMGGMFGESKFDVLRLIPRTYAPPTILIKNLTDVAEALHQMKNSGLTFPVICKPDLGERGFRVEKIANAEGLRHYFLKSKFPFLIQAFVDAPLEFGIFYIRYPSQTNGRVTSVVMKEMLHVIGDGKQTLRGLIIQNARAKLQLRVLNKKFGGQLDDIIAEDQKIELVSIGNHNRGTKFLNGEDLINEHLHGAFDLIAKQIEGFYFGRFDLRCNTLDDLYKGRIQIMELNGCGAEPAHIYAPGFSLWKAMGLLLKHWTDIFRISRENHERGVPYIPFLEARRIYKIFKATFT